MKVKKRILLLLLIVVLAATSLVGCSKKETGQKPTDDTETVDDYKINLGYYNCDHMVGACIGEAAGIYKDLGLNVEITGGGKVPEAIAAGKMDAGYIWAQGVIGANVLGSPIVIGANNHIGGSRYLVVSSDIEKPEDIIGQKMASGDPAISAEWLCGYKYQLDLPLDAEAYELVNVGSDADKYVALATGQIKAMTCCDPWGSMAEYEGTGRIIGINKEMEEKMGICCSFALNENFVKDHPELAKKLTLAHTKSIEYVYSHPYKAAEIFAEYYDVPLEVSLMTIYKKTIGEGRTLSWELKEENLNHLFDMIKKHNLLENVPETLDESVNLEVLNSCGAKDFDTFIKEEIDPIFPLGMTYEEFKKKAMEIDGIDE